MRVHLKKVVQSAVEKGVAVGYHRVTKLSARRRANTDVVIDTLLHSIWESLDGIIDFSDDDEETTEKPSRSIGYGVDAVSDVDVAPDDDTDTDEEEDDIDAIVPLNVLHRIQYHTRHRKP